MSSAARTAATLDDLARVEGKAVLVSGRIVPIMPTGFRFEAGTHLVWDVDVVRGAVRKYVRDDSIAPIVFVAGRIADAEPAAPGRRMDVSRLFA